VKQKIDYSDKFYLSQLSNQEIFLPDLTFQLIYSWFVAFPFFKSLPAKRNFISGLLDLKEKDGIVSS